MVFARSQKLNHEQWFLLVVLGIAGLFEGYDSFLFTVALPQVRDTFGLTQSGASFWLSLLFLGSLPAVFVTRYADIYGRRRLLIASILGYSLFTGVTALSPSISTLVYCQFIARLFLNVEYALAWTMVAEALPARSRGFGFGWLATLSAVGAGLGSILYGLVFAPLGVSWRWLYLLGIPPLLILPFVRRGMPESARFLARRATSIRTRWHDILKPPHRRWLLLVGLTDMLFALVAIGDVFTIDFMQTNRGLTPQSSNVILFAAGLLAIPFLLASGSLSDRFGRKLTGCTFAVIAVLGALSFYLLAQSATTLFLTLFVMFIGQFGAWPTLDAFYAELFPTELRAFAGSAATIWRVPGEFLSLSIGGALIAASGDLSGVIAILSIGPVIATVVVWITFPETTGRELEDIHAEGEERLRFTRSRPQRPSEP